MTGRELKDYARFLIQDHAVDVEYLSIFEMVDQFFSGDLELEEEEASRVADLIGRAHVTVTWPED